MNSVAVIDTLPELFRGTRDRSWDALSLGLNNRVGFMRDLGLQLAVVRQRGLDDFADQLRFKH